MNPSCQLRVILVNEHYVADSIIDPIRWEYNNGKSFVFDNITYTYLYLTQDKQTLKHQEVVNRGGCFILGSGPQENTWIGKIEPNGVARYIGPIKRSTDLGVIIRRRQGEEDTKLKSPRLYNQYKEEIIKNGVVLSLESRAFTDDLEFRNCIKLLPEQNRQTVLPNNQCLLEFKVLDRKYTAYEIARVFGITSFLVETSSRYYIIIQQGKNPIRFIVRQVFSKGWLSKDKLMEMV